MPSLVEGPPEQSSGDSPAVPPMAAEASAPDAPREAAAGAEVNGPNAGADVANGADGYGPEAGAAAGADEANEDEEQGDDAGNDEEEDEADGSEEGDAEVKENAGDSNGNGVEPSDLDYAQKLFDNGCESLRADDFDQAADFLSRALEIRAQHFGELAIECAPTYYKYGIALLYKAQGESDALNEPTSLNDQTEQPSSGTEPSDEPAKGHEEEEQDIEEEEESDLDMAWKMLDIARAIYEKQQSHSIQEVDVITALADVSLEREDFEMCFRDYTRALEILEGLVESDSRRIAELCFKLSLAQQLGYKPKEALRYCQQAVSVCETRLRRLRSEVAVAKGSTGSKGKSILDESSKGDLSSGEAQDAGIPETVMQESSEQEEEIKEIEQLLEDLREKVVELQEMAAAPSLLETLKETNPDAVSSIQQVFGATARVATENIGTGSSSVTEASSNGFDAPIVSASTTVTDLGIVGRGVKRATPVCVSSAANGTNASKKRSLDDMMTRGGVGETEIGFGASSHAGGMSSNN